VRTTPYWLADEPEPLGLRNGRIRPDVVVIGGGVTGCACALALAERGLRVRLLEAAEVASGASGRNGGFALRGGAMPYDRARRQLGHEAARELWALTERALDRIEELAGDAFRRTGSLRLAAGADEAETLAAEQDALREDGFAVECAELPPRLAARFSVALLHPHDGAIHPVRWVRKLAARAVAAGADVAEGVRVRASDVDALDAEAIVVATEGATRAVLPELHASVWPLRGQMLATEPLPERVFARPHYAREGYDYWQQLPDRRLVVGGRRDVSFETEETDVDATTGLIQSQLESLVRDLVGTPARITHRWSGVWGETRDRLPLVGRLPTRDRVWVAAGYSGHGNVLGFACGELVARAIAGERPPELALLDPARLQLELRQA